MRQYGVVRALWGDVLARGRRSRPPDPYCNLLRSVRESVRRGDQSDLVCVWGEDNYQFCLSLGLRRVVLMDPRPYAMKRVHRGRGDRYSGRVVWGANHHWHRWRAVWQGFADYDALVTVDWDVTQVAPLDTVWWERQDGHGIGFRAALTRQWNVRWAAGWRLEAGRSLEEARQVPWCGCFWVSDREFVQACMAWCERVPHWMLQQAAAKQLDTIHNQPISGEVYRRLGYDAEWVDIGHRVYPARPEATVWKMERN